MHASFISDEPNEASVNVGELLGLQDHIVQAKIGSDGRGHQCTGHQQRGAAVQGIEAEQSDLC